MASHNEVIKEVSKPIRGYWDMIFNNPQGIFVGILVLFITVAVGGFVYRTVNGMIDGALQTAGITLDEPLISYDTFFEAEVVNGKIAQITSHAKGILTKIGSAEIVLKNKGIYIISATARNETSMPIIISHQKGEGLIGGRTILHLTKENNEVIEVKPNQNATLKIFYMGLNKNNENKLPFFK